MRFASFAPGKSGIVPVEGWFDAGAVDYGDRLPPAEARVTVDDETWDDMTGRITGRYVVDRGPPPHIVPTPERPAAELLAAARRSKLAELAARLAQACREPFESAALGVPHVYDRDSSPEMFLAGVVMATDARLPVACAELGGEVAFREHDAKQMLMVGRDAMAHIAEQRRRYCDRLAQLDDAESREQVDAIGW